MICHHINSSTTSEVESVADLHGTSPLDLLSTANIAGRVLAGGLKLELTTRISGYALSVSHPSVELATKPADAAASCSHPPYFVSIRLHLHYYPTGKTKYMRKSVMKKYINGKEASTIEER
jgi:hypothetical protein